MVYQFDPEADEDSFDSGPGWLVLRVAGACPSNCQGSAASLAGSAGGAMLRFIPASIAAAYWDSE